MEFNAQSGNQPSGCGGAEREAVTTPPKIRRRLNLPSGIVPVHTSLTPDTLHKVDAFIQRQKDKISRSEAIRRLIELGLKGKK